MTNSFIQDGFGDPEVYMRANEEEGVFALSVLDLNPNNPQVVFAYNPAADTWYEEGRQLTAQEWYDTYGEAAEKQIADDFYYNFEPDGHGDELFSRIVTAIKDHYDCQIVTVFGEYITPSPYRQGTNTSTLLNGLPFVSALHAVGDELREAMEETTGTAILSIDHANKMVHVAHNPPRETMGGMTAAAWHKSVEDELFHSLNEYFVSTFDPMTAYDPDDDEKFHEQLLDAALNDYQVWPVTVWGDYDIHD